MQKIVSSGNSKSVRLEIRLSPEEKNEILYRANLCNMTIGSYMRSVGVGFVPKTNINLNAIDNLLQINADLGRLGGLLKLWLTDDLKLTYYSKYGIRHLVNKIEVTRDKLEQVMDEVLEIQ